MSLFTTDGSNRERIGEAYTCSSLLGLHQDSRDRGPTHERHLVCIVHQRR